MTYETFLTEILHQVRKSLPASTEANLRRVQKNNNQLLDGLVISAENTNASPTIYLNSLYHNEYQNGASLEEICHIILKQYDAACLKEPIDVSFFSDFSSLKDQIIFRIINRDMNTDLLQRVPHIDYLDLSITFLVLLSVQQSADATILIHNSHLDIWHTNVDELFALAKKNTPRLLAWDMTNMRDILSSLEVPVDDLAPSPDDLAFPMYVLTNNLRLHGAGCILYDHLLSSLSKKLDDDLCIIPSSIHEVLLIPHRVADEKTVLDSMIRDVNRTQVPDEEILSNHAYFYSRERDEIVY